MKTFEQAVSTLQLELKHWFTRQCHNPVGDNFVYYIESTQQHNGGFLICQDQPVNPDYKLAKNSNVSGFKTVDQNFNRLLPVIKTLPILDS